MNWTPPSGSARAKELRGLADAVRQLTERMVASEAPLEVFAGVADDIRAVAERFAGYPKSSLYGYAEAATAGDVSGPFDHSPMLGLANPLAPPLRIAVDGDQVRGTARFGSAYEGPPGCVHGGFVAAAFDELLGLAQTIGGNPGMTGRLVVHYRSPTPLHHDLTLVGWIERVDGRKTICKGTIHAGDRLCAEAEGLFVAVNPEIFAGLLQQREANRPS